MDTRTKIRPSLAGFDPARPLLVVTGRFDTLRYETVREIADARRRAGARSVLAIVWQVEGELLPAAARAEMAAALRMIDYVFIAPSEHPDGLADFLQPTETMHLEDTEAGR